MIDCDDRRESFERLYDAHRHGVWAYFLGRHSDPGTAEELTQETFLRLWRRIEEVADLTDGAQRGWIFHVARNLSTDTYRSRAAGAAATRTLTVEATRAPPATDVADLAAGRARLAEVDRAIMTLSEPLRLVLTMTAVGGMRAVDIAEALGEPAGTIRYRLSTARRRLRELLIMESELEAVHG